MKKQNNTNIEKAEAIKYLKSIIKPNTEILVNINSVSASGMSRKMTAYVVGKVARREYKKNSTESKLMHRYDLIRLNYYLMVAGMVNLDGNSQIKIGGWGMDMAFALTYDIKCSLYGYDKGISNQQYRVI